MIQPAQVLTALFAALVALGVAAPGRAAPLSPLSPQPQADALKDGLAVDYYYSVFEHIVELTTFMQSKKGEAGPPLPQLNYKVGIGNVLTTTSGDFVGAHITGAIKMETAGTYQFEVTSNDGVRVSLGGEQIFTDPGIHPDSTSPPIDVEITEPGWYALDVLYFEKKNTSTLILRWKQPGAADFEVVPAAAFKHLGAS